MLAHISSRELAEWMAFERYEGPIGPGYERAALRAIASANRGEKDKPFPTPAEVMQIEPASQNEQGTFDAELQEEG